MRIMNKIEERLLADMKKSVMSLKPIDDEEAEIFADILQKEELILQDRGISFAKEYKEFAPYINECGFTNN